MSNEWIKLQHRTFTHPKITRMASALEADNLRTVGGAAATWCYFDVHSDSGTLKNYRPEMLDAHLNWPGFAAQMIAVGWLEDDGENLTIPRFSQQNGRSAKRRALDAARKKRIRNPSGYETDNNRTRKENKTKELNEHASPSASANKKGCRLPEDWQPSPELIAWARAERPDIDPYKETEAFRDYWRGIPGQRGCKLDWDGTFRNRIRDKHTNTNSQVVQSERPVLRDLTGGGQ